MRVDLRLHARLDRPRRGRPDAPADRARRDAAPDPEPGRLASVRHGRDRGRLGAARSSARTARPRCCCSRQNLPFMQRERRQLDDIARGGYVLAATRPSARGRAHRHRLRGRSSRCEAQKQLAAAGHRRARGLDAVDRASSTARTRPTRRSVLPAGCRASRSRPASPTIWRKYVGLEGAVVGIDRFGESAPAGELFKHFGFTPENVAESGVVRSRDRSHEQP